MAARRPAPRTLSYERCLHLLLEHLGRAVEVTIAPGDDEPIIYASFQGTLQRAKEVPLWAGVAGSGEALLFRVGEDGLTGFVLYPGRFRSAYAEDDARGRGLSIEQGGIRIDLWFSSERKDR